ncbi:MAG TPA: hypothetical protein RMH99_19865 [Sandaracinaceae bacterium LLY-WYZ-13_1]|nr:hypothetical protein [Sandaracinaceae bacterium LLY-WYZ-13_1]
MGGDFDRLAARGRDNAPPERSPEELAARAEQARKNRASSMVVKALGDWGDAVTPFLMVGSMIVGIGVVVFVLSLFDYAEKAIYAIGLPLVALLGVGFFLGWRAVGRWLARREEASLRRLAFDLDVDGYLEGLANERKHTKATVVVWFAEAPKGSDRKAILDAVRGASEVASRSFRDDGTMVVVSPRVETFFLNTEKQEQPRYHNGRIHRWVRRHVRKGLCTIHGRYPIERAQITLGE